MFRPEDCPELLLRLRPILRLRAIALALRVGLALRATPAAPNRKGNIFFMARPPLLCEEGNSATAHVVNSDDSAESGSPCEASPTLARGAKFGRRCAALLALRAIFWI